MARIQKEKEIACNEIDSFKDKLELNQSQLAKLQREREVALNEVDAIQEKYDKAATQAQRMMVRISFLPPTLSTFIKIASLELR